jgi:cytochrome c peroxidase
MCENKRQGYIGQDLVQPFYGLAGVLAEQPGKRLRLVFPAINDEASYDRCGQEEKKNHHGTAARTGPMEKPHKRAPYTFPSDKDRITMPNVVTAIAAFEATLVTPNAPFDKFLRGDANALSAEQKEGLKLFIDTGCAVCHSGVNVGGQMYAPFGVVEKPGADILPPNDKGRFAVTKTVSDEYVFRVPELRNIELTPPYFHSGQVWDLTQAVGIMATDQLGKTLTDAEVAKIVAFLSSLTGEQPQVTYPILPPSTATTPQPQP